MTDPTSIANALYGTSSPTPAQTAGALNPSTLTAAATPARPLGAGPERAATPTDMEVTAAALYGDGGEPAPNPEVYDSVLNSGFDALEHQARFDANQEDVGFYREARQQAAGLMHELQIGVPAARQITVALSAYGESPLSDDALEAKNAETEATLRAEWGAAYSANVAQARRVYKAALAKMPSLSYLIESGGGSDPSVIRAFYNAGKRGRR